MTDVVRPEVLGSNTLVLPRQSGNLLALSVAAYREGDVDTAFDLFISGMEATVAAQETAVARENFGSLIEAALQAAIMRSDSFAADNLAEVAFDNDDDDLADLVEADLLEAGDEVEEVENTSEGADWRQNLASL